jgi:hypothetical protein
MLQRKVGRLGWKALEAGMQDLKIALGAEYSKSAKLAPTLGQVGRVKPPREFNMMGAWTCMQDPVKSGQGRQTGKTTGLSLQTNLEEKSMSADAESSRRSAAYIKLMERFMERHSKTIVAAAPPPLTTTTKDSVVASRVEPVWNGEAQQGRIIADRIGDTQGSKLERMFDVLKAESVKRKRNSKMNKHKHRKRKKKAKFKKRKV